MEILDAVADGCTDIKFTEDGRWTPILSSKTSASAAGSTGGGSGGATDGDDADRSLLLIHTVTGLSALSLCIPENCPLLTFKHPVKNLRIAPD